MSETKDISKKSYVWAHAGVIIYHVLTALLLILSQFRKKILNISSRTIVLILAGLLLIVSLLSIWPIAMNYNKIVIE